MQLNQDRARRWVGFVLLAAMLTSGRFPSQLIARGQDSPPKVEALTPRLVYDAKVDAGTFVLVSDNVPPQLEGVKRVWSVKPKVDFGPAGQGNGPTLVYTGVVGTYSVHESVTVPVGKVDFQFELEGTQTIGMPEPPKPVQTLAELAGDQATALTTACNMLATVVAQKLSDTSALVLKNWGDYADLQKVPADNLARVEIAARLKSAAGGDALSDAEREAVVSTLAKCVKELDAKPGPLPPGPVPTSEKLWIVAVSDGLHRPVQEAALLTNVSYWDAQRAKGHEFQVLEPAAAERYAKWINGDTLILSDFGGHVLGAEKIPATADQAWADSMIAKYGAPKNAR